MFTSLINLAAAATLTAIGFPILGGLFFVVAVVAYKVIGSGGK
jgi:hypothetical protein